VYSFPNNSVTDRTTGEVITAMYILRSVPTSLSFEPVGFPKGSRFEFEEVMQKVKRFWGISAPKNVADWIEFEHSALIPESDSVEQYLQKYPDALYIPLLKELFGKVLTNSEMDVNINDTNDNTIKLLINDLPIALAQPVVTWSNRGNKVRDAQVARVLTAPAGSMPTLEAAMVEHNKPIERKKNKPKEKTLRDHS
jgi:hypothetical protein